MKLSKVLVITESSIRCKEIAYDTERQKDLLSLYLLPVFTLLQELMHFLQADEVVSDCSLDVI